VVALDDGTAPEGVIWTVSHPEVVDVQHDRVVVVGPGEASVTAEWEGARVGFHVVVALDTRLGFAGAPASLRVGEARALVLTARLGDQDVDPGPVGWESSDVDVVRVEAGTVTAMLPGTAWVTARGAGGPRRWWSSRWCRSAYPDNDAIHCRNSSHLPSSPLGSNRACSCRPPASTTSRTT
jgi:hypothetical protein